ncbi:hypothetical protein IPH67_00020 [bacterium]|nr:MAG: hypothetical protein IPH67_00020 [bacterium]
MQQGQPKIYCVQAYYYSFHFFLRTAPFFNSVLPIIIYLDLSITICITGLFILLLPLLLYMSDFNDWQNRTLILTQERDKAVKELVELKQLSVTQNRPNF